MHDRRSSSCFGEMVKNLPVTVSNLRSGSVVFAKFKVNSFSPLKTERKTKRAMVLAIIPMEAIPVMIFIALFLLKLIVYLLAM